MSRFYSGGGYAPRVLPKPEGPGFMGKLAGAGIGFALGGPAGALKGLQVGSAVDRGGLAEGIESYIGIKRQDMMDAERAADREYAQGRREVMDPLEEALLRSQLYERGVVSADAAPEGAGFPEAIDRERSRGADLMSGASRFGDRGLAPAPAPTGGIFAPGSFNPSIGAFNPAPMDPGFMRRPSGGARDPGFEERPGRIPAGPGYEIDPSRTPEGRKAALVEREIAAMVNAGVPREHAEAEVRGGLGAALAEHLHPGGRSHENIDPLSDEGIAARIRLEREQERLRNTRGGARAREDLHSVERQVDDTRADLGRAEREMPTRPMMADMDTTVARRYSADSTAAAGRVEGLRARADSLGGVRDSIAGEVQGRDMRRRPDPVARARTRAQELNRQGKSRADIRRIMRAEGFNVE